MRLLLQFDKGTNIFGPTAKIPKPRDVADDQTDLEEGKPDPLPLTLVRIPTEHAPALQAQTDLLESEQNLSDTP